MEDSPDDSYSDKSEMHVTLRCKNNYELDKREGGFNKIMILYVRKATLVQENEATNASTLCILSFLYLS